MKKQIFIKPLFFIIFGCFMIQCQSNKEEQKVEFKKEHLQQITYDINSKEQTLEVILHSLRKKIVIIYLWASWCPDCNKNLSSLKKIKEKYNDKVTILFLSIDRNFSEWKKAVKDIKITGKHFYLGNNLNSSFCKFINLDWIPRYMIIGKDSKIKLFDSEEHTDPRIIQTIEKEINYK